MTLKRLRLTSFRQYPTADIRFHNGLTAIVGPNGSGKTTIFEAIVWALYGEQRGVKDTVSPIWAPENAEPTSVRLEFDFHGEPYAVERTLKTATLTKLVEPERIMAKSLKAVTEEVERLLGLNYEQFKNSFCAEQKDLTFLNFSTKGRQQEEVARMLGYDRLRIAEKIARQRAKDADSRRKGMDEALAKEPERNAELQQATKEEAERANDLETARATLAQLEQRRIEEEPKGEKAQMALSLMRRLESRKDLVAKYQQAEQEANSRLEDFRSKIEERDNLAPVATEFEANERELQSLRQESEKVRLRQTIQAKHDDAARRLAALEEELAKLPPLSVKEATNAVEVAQKGREDADLLARSIRERFQRERATVEQELKQKRADIERLQDRLRELTEAVKDGLCPTCKQPLKTGHLPECDTVERQLSKAVEKVQTLEIQEKRLRDQPDDLVSAEERLKAATKTLENAQSALTEATAVESKRETLLSQAHQLKSSLDEYQAQLAKLPAKFDEQALTKLEARQSQIRPEYLRFQQLANLDNLIANAESDLQKAIRQRKEEETQREQTIAELRSLGYGETDLQKAEQDVQSLATIKAQCDQARNHVTYCEKALQSAKERKRRAEMQVEEIRELKRKARELDAQRLLFSELRTAFDELRNDLNSRTRPLLEVYAGAALNELSGGRYDRIGLTERYEPEVYDDGVKKPVISGGEEDIVALALRLALARMIQERSGQHMSLLILDEVFGSLDDERRENVLTYLEALRGMFDQIIFISHIERVNEAADRCLRVSYDPNKKQSYIVEDQPLDTNDLPDSASPAILV